jgi:hypothetical protein
MAAANCGALSCAALGWLRSVRSRVLCTSKSNHDGEALTAFLSRVGGLRCQLAGEGEAHFERREYERPQGSAHATTGALPWPLGLSRG